MALLWEKLTATTHYQVKSAGNSIRLYSNGVFHSQWNPQRPVIGQLWELLFLPALFLKSDKPLRILLLGVGGGTVINLLYRFLSIQRLEGIELDKVHLQIARRWFKSFRPGVNFVHAEAQSWLQNYRGPKFDYIIEDLFKSDEKGEVLRAVDADPGWLKLLSKNLSANGVLTMNFESIKQANRCWVNAAKPNGHKSGLLLLSEKNENAIACFSAESLSVQGLKARMQAYRELDIQRPACRLDVSFRTLKK